MSLMPPLITSGDAAAAAHTSNILDVSNFPSGSSNFALGLGLAFEVNNTAQEHQHHQHLQHHTSNQNVQEQARRLMQQQQYAHSSSYSTAIPSNNNHSNNAIYRNDNQHRTNNYSSLSSSSNNYNPPPPPIEAPPLVNDEVAIKRAYNKLAARKSRARKKEIEADLKATMCTLSNENEALKTEHKVRGLLYI
jgi:hypothetical protein